MEKLVLIRKLEGRHEVEERQNQWRMSTMRSRIC